MSANGSSRAKLERMEEGVAALELEVSKLKMSQDKSLSSAQTNTGASATKATLPVRKEQRMRCEFLVIKAVLGDEIRTLTISPTVTTCDALNELVGTAFVDYNLHNKSFHIKFMDEDGDLVTLRNNDDMSHFQCLDPIPKIIISIQK